MRRGSVLCLCLTVVSGAPASALDARKALDRLAGGGWMELTESADGTVPDTTLSRVFPSRDRHPAWGVSGPRAVTDAWGGGAYDPKRGLFIVTGGGHRDYGGNEVYGFSLETLKWQRLTEPSRYDRDGTTIDRTPVSRHTYDGVEYLPGIDRVAMFGGSVYPTGFASDPYVWLFDVDRRVWTRGARAPQVDFVAAAVDPATGAYYARLPTGLLRYDSARDSWQVLDRNQGFLDYGSMAYAPSARRLVTLGHGATWYYTLGKKPVTIRVKAATVGDTDVEAQPAVGLAYAPDRGRIFAWAGDRAVWSLDAGTLRWRRYDNAAGPAPKRHGREGRQDFSGIYGRWRYVAALGAFVCVLRAHENVWLYRPPSQ